jgi:hypothetical protein
VFYAAGDGCFIVQATSFLGATKLIPTYLADNLSNPSISFPLRLQQGLLRKTDEREAYLILLGIMARTPQGSWDGHPLFGFQEFFPAITTEGLSEESRTHLTIVTVEEINSVLNDVGLTRYSVDSLVLDPPDKDAQSSRAQWTGRAMDERGVTLMLRETGSHRAIGYAL